MKHPLRANNGRVLLGELILAARQAGRLIQEGQVEAIMSTISFAADNNMWMGWHVEAR